MRRHLFAQELRTLGLALLALLAWPTAGSAFSDPALFGQAAVQGGGGGRHFTGSPVDGHSCSVCHVPAGPAPELRIEGLPDRFEPGERYRVSLRWDGAEVSHALQLELSGKDGKHAALELPEPDALPDESRCDGDPEGDPAVYEVDVEERRVLGASDCGASRLDFAFTAPDVPELYFAVGMARSNREGDAEGDGVLELRRVLYNVSQPEPSAGCSAVAQPRADGRGGLVVLLLLAALIARRRALLLVRTRARRVTRNIALTLGLLGAGCSDVAPKGSPGNGVDAAYLIDRFTPEYDAGRYCPPVGRSLSFDVQTRAFGGRWQPRNVGAIWIEDSEGTFIKTLERWATVRAKYLVRFMESTNNDVVDALTSATLSEHEHHQALWDLSDRGGCEVPDGPYRLVIELTDQNRAGASFAVDFDKGPEPFERNLDDEPTFRDMVLRLD